MQELECMKVVDTALQAVEDDSAKRRVVSWIVAKHGDQTRNAADGNYIANAAEPQRLADGQIPGIAKLSQSGEIQLTVRDFKAKSANDAAIRLVHVLIWVAGKLTQDGSISSKGLVVPWLKKYRCYDGNTRSAIAQDKGIVRDGDALSLDFHGEQLAARYVEEILNPEIEGKWKPGGARKRSTRGLRVMGAEEV